GRRFDDESRQMICSHCPSGVELQVVIGDGLSAAAVAAQAPSLLDALETEVRLQGWSFGRPFLSWNCRVTILNDVRRRLRPETVVLLIGERPGLATAESLSAYMAYRPRQGHTDADRNLISNIHSRGVGIQEAVVRIMALAIQFRAIGRSGVHVKEMSAQCG